MKALEPHFQHFGTFILVNVSILAARRKLTENNLKGGGVEISKPLSLKKINFCHYFGLHFAV